MSTAAAVKGPIRPRTRGPVELILEVTFGLLFVALFAWIVQAFVGAIAGFVLLLQRRPLRLGMHAQGPLPEVSTPTALLLLIDDTEGFARRIIGWVAWPYERFGVVRFYERMHQADAAPPAAAAQPAGKRRLNQGLGNATRSVMTVASRWAVVSMHVAQDVVLRLSVALFALPAFALACIVGTVDGLVRRDLRRWRGGRESSFVYHHAKRYTAWALTGGFGLYLTWPFGGFNPAYMVLVFTVLVAATLSTTVAAFKKYV